jgi:glucosylglycerate phosphorylase
MARQSAKSVGGRIEKQLALAYGTERVPHLLARIEDLVDHWQPAMSERRPWVNQRDAMLITYADTLRSPNEAPLATLHDFVAERIGDLVSAVHLLPFFPWSSDDGFSVEDYRAVDPAVGSWRDVAAFAADYELMFDAVINHASAESAWFQGFKEGVAPFDGYFVRADPAADYSAVVRPRALPLLTEVETTAGPVHVWTTFSADQVDLDYRNPDLLLEVLDILLDYCAKGARFIRLDAIGFMWKKQGTGCMHLPETHALVQVMRAVVEATAPGTLIITETNVPHAENVSYFGEGAPEAHLVYQFPLPPLVQHAFQTGDAGALTAWATALEPPPAGTTFFNFLASHDGIGMRPLEGVLPPEAVSRMAETVVERGGAVSLRAMPDGSTRPYELNISYIDGLVPAEADDKTRAAAMIAAHGILLSMAGLPGIYIQSLLGSRSDHAGMAATGRNRSINRARLDAAAVRADLDDPVSLRHLVFTGIAHLLRTRAGEPTLHPDAKQNVLAFDPALFVLERRTGGGRRLLAAINVTCEPRELWAADAADWSDILTGERFGQPPIAMAPYAVRWLVAADAHR